MATQVEWPPTLLLAYDRRQQGGANTSDPSASPSGNPNPNNGNNNQPPQGAPLSVFTFIIAIALFVLVVSFVLLRIFVRNRRLRRLGIYPESPIERLLGGVPREYEDTLPPPKLWHAKIADVRAHNAGAQARAEKNMLGANVGAGDAKEVGWDALMPVAAALPPNLYPIIYQADGTNASVGGNGAQTASASGQGNQQHVGRLGMRMPNFLRRPTSEGVVAPPDTPTGNDAAADAHGAGANAGNPAGGLADTSAVDSNEKFASSVNITVLIAMPSPKTVFPTTRKPAFNASNASLRRSTSKLNGSGILPGAQSKLAEVDEDPDNVDELSFKGKARRTPSLRSIRTTASTKSQGEARREAFFAQAAATTDAKDEKAALPPVEPKTFEDDEEEELPELVFGTASVPLYSKIVPASVAYSGRTNTAGPLLITPTRSELLALIAAAAEARSQKPIPSPLATKGVNADEADGDGLAANRRSVAGTSMEGGLSATEDQSGLGDVVSRMVRPTNGESQLSNRPSEAYELGLLSRPSLTSGVSSFVRSSSPAVDAGASGSLAHLGLTSAAADMGVTDGTINDLPTPTTTATERHPLFPASVPATPNVSQGAQPNNVESSSPVAPSASATATSTRSMRTAPDHGASSPTHTAQTDTERLSISSWRTGNEASEVGNVTDRTIRI